VIPGGGPGLMANEADSMTIPKKPIMAIRMREVFAVIILFSRKLHLTDFDMR
jgi:hypothetical protein